MLQSVFAGYIRLLERSYDMKVLSGLDGGVWRVDEWCLSLSDLGRANKWVWTKGAGGDWIMVKDADLALGSFSLLISWYS